MAFDWNKRMRGHDICSVWAYDEIKESGYLGKRQAQYLFIFSREMRPLTHKQATKLAESEFSIRLPERNGRIAELEEMGFLRKHDVVVCEVTNHKVNRWMFTGRKTPFESDMVMMPCPHCEGIGQIKQKFYIKDESQIMFYDFL